MQSRRMANVYRQYWRINLLTTLEYRENFLIWFLFTFIYHGTAIASLWIVLERFPSMNGWNFRDMFFLYALWMVAHALHNTFFSSVGEIPDHIRDGEFDRLLVRPLDTLFRVRCSRTNWCSPSLPSSRPRSIAACTSMRSSSSSCR